MVAAPRTVIRTAGIALAIAAGVAFAPARVEAACGDYVHIAGQPADPSGEAMPTPAGHDRGLPGRPCHGPGCSGKPAQPVAPLTTPVSESGGAKQVAARSGANHDWADGSSRHRIPHAIGSPVHLPTAIFDPPRA